MKQVTRQYASMLKPTYRSWLPDNWDFFYQMIYPLEHGEWIYLPEILGRWLLPQYPAMVYISYLKIVTWHSII